MPMRIFMVYIILAFILGIFLGKECNRTFYYGTNKEKCNEADICILIKRNKYFN